MSAGDGVSPFLGDGGTSPPNGGGHRAGLPASSSAAVAALSSLSADPDHGMRQAPARGARGSLTASRSAPSGSIASCPPQDLPARAKSLGEIPAGACSFQEAGGAAGGHLGFYPEGAAMAGSMESDLIGVNSGGGGQHAAAPPVAPPRGPLPMTLDQRSKAHLRTFMRTLGSLVLLPGNDAIRGAVYSDVCDSEEMPNAPTGGSASGVESDGKAGGGKQWQPAAGDRGGRGDGGAVSTFNEARRAEAWAAAAVGAQFSGAGEQEGKEYVSRSLRAMSQCLDAPLPEVRIQMCVCAPSWFQMSPLLVFTCHVYDMFIFKRRMIVSFLDPCWGVGRVSAAVALAVALPRVPLRS